MRKRDKNPIDVLKNLFGGKTCSPVTLFREIERADSVKKIAKIYAKLPALIKKLIENGAKQDKISSIITAFSDIIANKIINFGLKKLGPAPTEFAFIALGSEGRCEQTLLTDQDNAIIHKNVPPRLEKQTKKYFLKLGEYICKQLNTIGYRYCKGKIMAKNPKWRGSVSEWKKYFSGWINEPNPAELMKVNIFFDFRCVFGSEKLTQILRKHISETTKGKSVFFLHLAKNAISNKPPLKFLGSFDTTSKGKHRNFFDIKRPLLIISDYARIYALKYNSKETNTLKRLEIFTKKGILDKAEYAETLQAYNILMQHRFKHQAELLSKNKKPDNFINPKNLTKIERDILKSAFNQINLISKKIKFLIQFNLL